jgi:hypothetical protein
MRADLRKSRTRDDIVVLHLLFNDEPELFGDVSTDITLSRESHGKAMNFFRALRKDDEVFLSVALPSHTVSPDGRYCPDGFMVNIQHSSVVIRVSKHIDTWWTEEGGWFTDYTTVVYLDVTCPYECHMWTSLSGHVDAASEIFLS